MSRTSKLKSAFIGTVAFIAAVFLLSAVALADRTFGGDYSRYQPSLYNNTGHDSFAISQIGGSQGGYIYTQATYYSHAQQARNRGWRFHTYVWDQTGSNTYQTQQMLSYFIPRVSQPKGAIIALDYEAGASWNVEANTDNILYGMRMIQQAGYTPMLYSYKPYLLAHVDINRVLAAFPNSLWVAGYQPGLGLMPNYGYFASLPGVAMWQYSDYGGQQDMNVDLLNITYNGYGNKPAPAQPQQQLPAPKPQPKPAPQHQGTIYYTVRYGDSFWAIANRYGLNMYTLAAQNGLSINSTIYPGQRLAINGQNTASRRYTVRWGDSLWAIGQRYGESMYTVAAKNGLSIYSTIYPGQLLNV